MLAAVTDAKIIYIEGNCCRALLDTGAMVSSIAYKSCQLLLPHFHIHLFKNFKLDVTGAGDQTLPYMGYIEVDVSVPEIGLESVTCILLVVPDTQYTETVPVILGTNVLDRLRHQLESTHGVQFQQKILIPDAWNLTFRCMKLHSRAVTRVSGRLAIVKCAATRHFVIPGNATVEEHGKLVKRLLSNACVSITELFEDSALPDGVSVEPMLMNIGANSCPVLIPVSNLSSRPVTIASDSIICQVQSCNVITDMEAVPTSNTDPSHAFLLHDRGRHYRAFSPLGGLLYPSYYYHCYRLLKIER